MAIRYGFFDSNNHDRVYNSSDFGQIFDGIISDGIFQEYKNAFQVVAPGGSMRVNVSTGRAWFKNTWINNDAVYPVIIEDSETVNNRIDAIVIEINKTTRINSIKVIKGTGGLNPVKPSMDTGDDNIFWYPLAYVRINALVTEIIPENIEDSRGTDNVCPWASGVVQQLPIATLLQNYTADFDKFFEDWTVEKRSEFDQFMQGIVNELSENEIAALQAQILTKDNAPFTKEQNSSAGNLRTIVQFPPDTVDFSEYSYVVDIYTEPYGVIVERVEYPTTNAVYIYHKELKQDTTFEVLVRKI